MSTAADPAKRGAKRIRIGNVRFSNGGLPAHRSRLIGFPFWEHAASPASVLVRPFALRLEATELTRGLALTGMYYTNMPLGYETLFGSPGACQGTCSSRVRAWAIIHLPCMLQVSICVQSIYIYYADTTE